MKTNTILPSNQRIAVVDALRGLALLGIIIANVPHAEAHDLSATDQCLDFLFHWLVDKKFIPIFSMLFGFGFYIQMRQAEAKGIVFRPYFFKRMLVLLLLGCIHAYLFWFGDIVRDYAIAGMFLLLVYLWPNRRILAVALVFSVLLTGTLFIANSTLGWQTYTYDTSIVAEHPITLSYWRYLWINARIDPFVNFLQDSPITLTFCFGNMLLGFWLGKIGFFHSPIQLQALRERLIWIGLPLGLAASYLFYLLNAGRLDLGLGLIWLPYAILLGMLLQSLAYLSIVVSMFQRLRGQRVLRLFIPVGKMALSNYCLQTLFYLLCFFHWTHGLKLYGKLSLSATYLVAIALFALQVVLSHWWLRRHKQGPLEKTWKTLAYRFAGIKPQPNATPIHSLKV